MTFRPEIKRFCDAAETLLSPVLLQSPLTEDECSMIRVYIKNLESLVTTKAET
jgi:hypothetical protein